MFLKKYSKNQKFPIGKLEHYLIKKRMLKSPIHQAIIDGDQEFVSIIMERTTLDFQSRIQVEGQEFVTYLA